MIKNTNKGYTLLFSVIISSLVLAVGISILSISKKEFALSSSARESAYAFYAADSGLECVLYHDNGFDGTFSTSSNVGNVECGDDTLQGGDFVDVERDVDSNGTGTFTMHIKTNTGISDTSCASVEIIREYFPDPNYGNILIPRTTISSRGYNVGWRENGNQPGDDDCDGDSPKKVERGLKLTY
jgi:hypothetical protein